MIHPDTELLFVSKTIGYGVFATRFIPRGTITWVRDDLDQTFTCDQVAGMGEPYQKVLEKYSFVDAKGRMVLCWDHSRYINHSCEANCLSAGYDFEIAIRDIQPGDELTDDYGSLNLRTPFLCACESRYCRNTIAPDDMEQLAIRWDASVRLVFPLIPQLAQPLWPFLREKEDVEMALRDPNLLRSIKFNYSPLPMVRSLANG